MRSASRASATFGNIYAYRLAAGSLITVGGCLHLLSQASSMLIG